MMRHHQLYQLGGVVAVSNIEDPCKLCEYICGDLAKRGLRKLQ